MKRNYVVAALALCVFSLSLVASAQIKKGKTRPLTTKQLMGGLIGPNCGGIGEALKTEPADDKAWEALATKAALLNESSYTLMDDGRCPDDVWAQASTTLREGSALLLEKLEAKDLAGANEALKATTASCGACHKAHKK